MVCNVIDCNVMLFFDILKNGKNIFFKKNKISFQYPENEAEWFKTDCGHHLWIEIIFLKKNKKFKTSFQYLENDPLNVLELILDITYG